MSWKLTFCDGTTKIVPDFATALSDANVFIANLPDIDERSAEFADIINRMTATVIASAAKNNHVATEFHADPFVKAERIGEM